MTSHRQKDINHPMFTTKTPHFFKIILNQTIRDGKLKIPKAFVRKYARRLPTSVFLEVPSGEEWQVEVRKCGGRLWLRKGWKEFAKHYSLKYGHFVVFKYVGTSHFQVVIFDKCASEIEYPCNEDDSLKCKKRKEKLDVTTCPQTRKKMKTDSPNETGINLKSRILTPAAKGRRAVRQEGPEVEVITKRVRCLTADEKSKALQKASSFRTKNPFFMVVMQPSFISSSYRMIIPLSFAGKHLQNIPHGHNVILCISNGQTWTARYNLGEDGFNPQLRGAWRAFALDNALQVGDVCIFELTKISPEITLKVVIYRLDQETNAATSLGELNPVTGMHAKDISQGISGSQRGLKHNFLGRMQPLTPTEKKRVLKTASAFKSANPSFSAPFRPYGNKARGIRLDNFKGSPSSSSCSSNGIKPRNGTGRGKGIGSELPEQAVILGFRCLSDEEQAKTLRIANSFNSKNAFFLSVIQPSHTSKYYMSIPNRFTEKFFTKKPQGKAILCLSDGKSWSVEYKQYRGDQRNPRALFYAGWKEFAQDNCLMVGDICVFELLEDAEITWKVVIQRVADVARCDTSQAGKEGLEPEFLQPAKVAASKRASNIPLFRKVMTPYFVSQGGRVGIPFEFIEKHLKPDTKNVILQVADRLWVTKLSVNKLHRIAKLATGWTEFARENSLKVGDVCVFKMITSRDAAMLNVTISRIDG